MERRVVVTGMGSVTPIGNNVKTFWNNVKEGKCGIDFIKEIDTSDLRVKIAGEVKDFNSAEIIGKKESRRLDRYTQFAMAASEEAIKSSKIDLDKVDKNRFGVYVGSGIGGLGTLEKEISKTCGPEAKRVSPFFIPMSIINLCAGNIAIKYGAKGPCISTVTACASGNNNIGEAYRAIKHGYADIMLAGGSEAPITKVGIGGFDSLKTLNTSNDPNRASIPFDKERGGFVMGEGAGVLLLESLESAEARGAEILCEIAGYGSNCDAYHVTAPDPEGEGAAEAMKIAIEEGNIKKENVSYINAHGTSTELNDICETKAIKKVFGDLAYKIPVSSTKSMTGHLLGASGAIEAVICINAIKDSFIPATINLKNRDEELDLDYVPNKGRKAELEYVLSNSLGFGGHNAVLLFRKFS